MMRRILLVVMMVLIFSVNCGPVSYFNGLNLITISNSRFEEGTINDVYNQIGSKYEPNQILCKASWMLAEKGNLVPLIMFSVWYRPEALVSSDAECVDSEKVPGITASWYQQGYRWIGSGFEPHMGLIWLRQWKVTRTLESSTFLWCKSTSMAFASYELGEADWGILPFSRAVFEYEPAIEKLALVSRDVTCTNSQDTFYKWLRTPGWGFVNIGQ